MPATLPDDIIPIDAKPIPWLIDLLAASNELDELIDTYGSPLHLHTTAPFVDNISALQACAATAGIDFHVYFARKANKALCYVDAAIAAGAGIDLASVQELHQVLDANADPQRLVVTSAVKPDPLLALCLDRQVPVVLDNHDEALRYAALAAETTARPPVAIRLSNFDPNQPASRFGFDINDPNTLEQIVSYHKRLDVVGLHFHLDGYDANDRVIALTETLHLHDRLSARHVDIESIDIGGGFPTAYTDRPDQWSHFWDTLDDALTGLRRPITYRNDGYGQIVTDGNDIIGPRLAYPHAQQPTGAAWLGTILDAPHPQDDTIAQAIRQRRLELRCEPGRAILDSCGATISTVVHTKAVGDDLLVALDMNSSNCRTQKSELLTDPIHRPSRDIDTDLHHSDGCYLTGAYCSESDLITKRRIHFKRTPLTGDHIVFPNTAGYYMHFTESRSHQFPLPLNCTRHTDGSWRLDRIDDTTEPHRSP